MGDTRENALRKLELARAALKRKREAGERGDSEPTGGAPIDAGAAAAAAGEPAEPDARPRSGRPAGGSPAGPGTKPAGKEKSASLDLSGLAGIIAGLHALAAMRTGHPHWALNEADSKRYSIAFANVLRWYSVPATQKAIDHFALVMIASEIEGPRFMLSAKLNAEAKGQAPPRPSAPVFQFRTPGSAPPTAAAVVPEAPHSIGV